jgi:hypothetical protein
MVRCPTRAASKAGHHAADHSQRQSPQDNAYGPVLSDWEIYGDGPHTIRPHTGLRGRWHGLGITGDLSLAAVVPVEAGAGQPADRVVVSCGGISVSKPVD